jgi:hypothetical protein
MKKISQSIESMNITIDTIGKYESRQRRGTMTKQQALKASSQIMEIHIRKMNQLWESSPVAL